ncbi:MAG TPA: class I SAM-dependent methyltransferase [Streptosporangiaceae bacterium]|nr:class I SAM-dependent methyltransferase [Streptosporangiaceae bacterium]
MSSDDARLWTDRSCLRDGQYRTDANLAARQSLYRFQQPQLDLPPLVLDLAALGGNETVTDIGCGNGIYLAELASRRHTGPVLGMDLSPGMLQASRRRSPAVHVAVGDAAALPLGDDTSDLTLAAHMLYHLPQPAAAVRELRRVTRPGGQVLVVLNGEDHLRELRDLITTVLGRLTDGPPLATERLCLDDGEALLAAQFTSITRHDFTGELLIPARQPVEDYVRSMVLPDPVSLAAAVTGLIPASGTFRVRTHTGCLVCR